MPAQLRDAKADSAPAASPNFRTKPAINEVLAPLEVPVPQTAPPSDVAQVAPPVLRTGGHSRLPYSVNLGDDDESRQIAAEVAAILSNPQQSLDEPAAIKDDARRPVVVRLPSERWLFDASAKVEKLPLEEKAPAFKLIVEKYRAMRAAERESMRRR